MRPAKHVLYFALQPPPEAAEQALALAEEARRAHRLAGKPSLANRLHVSLNNIGEFQRPPAPVIGKALAAVQAVAVRPFVVEFNRLESWPQLVLTGEEGVYGINELYAALHKALGRIDLATRRMVEITPHMTLIHDAAEIEPIFVEPVSWRVTEFVLIHAVHGEGKFEVAGRVPLSG